MRRKGRPKKQKSGRNTGRRPGRPKRHAEESPQPGVSKKARKDSDDTVVTKKEKNVVSTVLVVDDGMSEGLHMTTSQVNALGALVSCRECGESIRIGVRPTTKGMISEFTVACNVCEDTKSTNTPNLIRERKRKREKKDAVLQKTENINYAHVAAFLDNGLGYSGLRHYCKYFNARCLNEATFIVYARQVISDVVADTEESLQYSASIVREVFKSQLETDGLVDLTVAFTTTYHQWGSDFCLVAGAVIELTTGLVLDYDVANMYCHVCKINAKKIVSMSPAEMTEWFNKHQDTCEIREWCDELDHDAEEGVREIEPKYLECFIAKKIWSRSIDKFAFRYTTLIHESDEKIHEELSRAGVYEDVPILIDSATSCFSRRKSEHARTSFQTKLKAKCPRERVQTKDRIMYVYAMSIPEYNKFAISSNIKLRHLVKEMEGEGDAGAAAMMQEGEQVSGQLQLHEVKAIRQLVTENGEEEEEEEEEEEREVLLNQEEEEEAEEEEEEEEEEEHEVNQEEQEVDDPEELEEDEAMEQGEEENEILAVEDDQPEDDPNNDDDDDEERRLLEEEWKQLEEEEEEEGYQEIEEKEIKHIKKEQQVEEIEVRSGIIEEKRPQISLEQQQVVEVDEEEQQLEDEEEEMEHLELGEEEEEEEEEEDEEEEEEEDIQQLREEREYVEITEEKEFYDEEEAQLEVEEELEEEEMELREEKEAFKKEEEYSSRVTKEDWKGRDEVRETKNDGLKEVRIEFKSSKLEEVKKNEEVKKSTKEDVKLSSKEDRSKPANKEESTKQINKEGNIKQTQPEENKQKEERVQREENEDKHSDKREDKSREQREDTKKVDDKLKERKEDTQKLDDKERDRKEDKQKEKEDEPKEKMEVRQAERGEIRPKEDETKHRDKVREESKEREKEGIIFKKEWKPSEKTDVRQPDKPESPRQEMKRHIESDKEGETSSTPET